MRGALFVAALLALAGCQTAGEPGWDHSGSSGTSFDQAEETCETQMEFVADENARPEFFAGCMAAFGWTARRAGAPQS